MNGSDQYQIHIGLTEGLAAKCRNPRTFRPIPVVDSRKNSGIKPDERSKRGDIVKSLTATGKDGYRKTR